MSDVHRNAYLCSMSRLKDLFALHVGQTSELPLMLEVSRAEGMYIYDTGGKQYLDLNSGISVSSLGHRHPSVTAAIEEQVGKYMHTMVYGEHVQSPQAKYGALLSKVLDNGLDCVYFVNSGSEAVEVAMKLARRVTRRHEIISCRGAYHGSTLGAESLRSDEGFKRHFAPGIPAVRHIKFNDLADLDIITEKTACVITEPVQAESGVIVPKNDYLKRLRERCTETGTLLILDEIQTAFGRTGYFFAHQKYGVVPDVMLIAKSMGGGMPVGGVVAPKKTLDAFTKKPMLGHITTFGGHPVSVAAAYATLSHLSESEIICKVSRKEQLIRSLLRHSIIKEVRSSGLMMAVELTKRKYLKHVVAETIRQGALIDYFLFNDKSFRLAPPLIISEEEIAKGVNILLRAMDYAVSQYSKG